MMRVLVMGNMGYVGPAVVRQLKGQGYHVTGLDAGFFAHCLVGAEPIPERLVDVQRFKDVRDVTDEDLDHIDAIVYLAAISNDPMGETFQAATMMVNHQAAIDIARRAKGIGVKRFVLASSCSVYGCADGGTATERSPLDPLTAYARSKVMCERDLAGLADEEFVVTCLRFGTACGMSDRLRLDLVLNDFVAGALATGRIDILSDGTPWRPLIDVADMARAMEWAVARPTDSGGVHLVVNVGSNDANYQVRELGTAVRDVLPHVELSINEAAQPDKRSYRVCFDLFAELAPEHACQVTLVRTVQGLVDGLRRIGFDDADFRRSSLVRLNVLSDLRKRELLDSDLRWTFPEIQAAQVP